MGQTIQKSRQNSKKKKLLKNKKQHEIWLKEERKEGPALCPCCQLWVESKRKLIKKKRNDLLAIKEDLKKSI